MAAAVASKKNYFFLGFGEVLIVRTIAVRLLAGDWAAFTDMKRPVIALSPIFLVFTGITSFPGLLPALIRQQHRVRTGGSENHKASEVYVTTQLLRVFLRQFPLCWATLANPLHALSGMIPHRRKNGRLQV